MKPIRLRLGTGLGFTLIELLVTIALVAVLAGLGIPSFQKSRINSQLDEAATDLMLSVQQAQSHALKINRNVVIAPVVAGDWRTGWRIFVKLDSNDTYNDGVDALLTTREELPAAVKVTTSPAPCSSYIANSSGYAGATTDCRIIFGSTETGRYKQVIFARFGRARVCTATSAAVSACPSA